MTDDQLNPEVRPAEPADEGQSLDQYIHDVVRWAFSAIATALVLAAVAIVLLTLVLTSGDGPGTPLPLKVALIVGGLCFLVGIGFAVASGNVPITTRKYLSRR